MISEVYWSKTKSQKNVTMSRHGNIRVSRGPNSYQYSVPGMTIYLRPRMMRPW